MISSDIKTGTVEEEGVKVRRLGNLFGAEKEYRGGVKDPTRERPRNGLGCRTPEESAQKIEGEGFEKAPRQELRSVFYFD